MERSFDHGYCHFYDEETRLCAIYQVRPKTAQEYGCWIDQEALDDYEYIYELWRETDLVSMGATIPTDYIAPWDQEEDY